jgi:hypothetical protein
VVQDPSDAAFPEMPTTALTRLEPDHVVGLAGMPRVETLTEIHRQPCSVPWPLRRALMSAWGQKRQLDGGWRLPVFPFEQTSSALVGICQKCR